MAEYIDGKYSTLKIYNGTDAYEPVVCLSQHALSESVAEVSSRTKCDADGATQRKAGAYTYEISFEGLYPKPETGKVGWVALRTKLRTLGNFTWQIETTYADATTDSQYGSGYFSNLELTANIDEDISFSGSLMGSGLISATDPNA